MQISNDVILVDGDMSGDLVSAPIAVNQLYGVTISSTWTGSPVGVLRLQLSCYKTKNILGADIDPNSWVNYDGTEIDVNVNVNGQQAFAWIDPAASHSWLRLVYKATSGTGVLNANFNAKAP